ncbi:MAG TPA: type II toxin-antitoxin system VapC family toxin [Thermoanaerobaculia bacterium]|nr:type II toxin-antitoxin system VapC family toxin [Thermoanaerobaculia bacterium]
MLVLDSDVLIDVQRGYPAAVDWFSGLTEVPAVPGLVVMELIQDARNLQEVRRALKLMSPLPIVWPTEEDCSRALSDFTAFRLSHSLGLLDALIASTAVGRAATLCTFNLKHYQVVPGLTTSQPYPKQP